jgi:D-3-phosphoglycerate dehydrogenase
MQKVLVTDSTFADLGVETDILKPLGVAVESRQCRTEADLLAVVPDADFIITQFAPVNARVIGAMQRAKVIVRYGIGVDSVDLEAARAKNIPVCNVPAYCIDEVADQTLAFILATTRQVVGNNSNIHSGRWAMAGSIEQMKTLRDLTVGVVGFGRIGREVVRRLLAFKCAVRVFDPVVAPAVISAAGASAAASIDELLPACDLVTLHCPSTAETRRIINRNSLAKLKPGAIFINVGRGDLVETAALVEALQSGHVAAAALDVCDPEPIPAGHPLLGMPNVILAPHIASCSVKATRTLRETVANIVAAAVRGETLPNVVNKVGPAAETR